MSEQEKFESNALGCLKRGWVCVPLVVEAYRGWGITAKEALSRIARLLAIHSHSSNFENAKCNVLSPWHCFDAAKCLSLSIWKESYMIFDGTYSKPVTAVNDAESSTIVALVCPESATSLRNSTLFVCTIITNGGTKGGLNVCLKL